jgi:SAM-dependent methyltransferase
MTGVLAVTVPGDELPVRFDWPLEAGIRPGLGLRLEVAGKAPAVLSIGRAFDPRARLLPLMRGVGVEVGPGANPQVRPAAGVDVHYIESASAEEWARRYRKQGGDDLGPLWDRYRVDSAHELAGVADGSLDFIFSNHVFEHLVNPLGVLRNWVRKLRPGGLIAGATPDARFSFDLRQPLSGPPDFLRERDAGGFELCDRHYDRWCRYTAPYNQPDELRARGYSIHAHYYSPAAFTTLAGLLPGAFDQVFTDTSPNNKDFGFLLRKSVEPA